MNQRMSITVKVIILVVLAVVFGATMIALSLRSRLPAREDDQTWGSDKKIERSFSVQPGGLLDIDADIGSVTTTGTDSGQVTVRVFARGSDENLRRMHVEFDQRGTTVRVTERTDHNYFRFLHDNNMDVHFEVSVPNNFNLRIRTAGGDLKVVDVKGKIDGETSGGDLELRKLEGNLRLETSGGNVDAEGLSGDCTCETSGGSIRAERIQGTSHFNTSGGNIEIRDADGRLVASTSGGDIVATLKGNQGIDLSTSGGNLTVRLPKATPGDVQAETSGGDVSCDLPFDGKIKDGRMNGRINGGGNLIRLETSGGDILISPMD